MFPFQIFLFTSKTHCRGVKTSGASYKNRLHDSDIESQPRFNWLPVLSHILELEIANNNLVISECERHSGGDQIAKVSAYLFKCKHEISDIHSNETSLRLDTFFRKKKKKKEEKAFLWWVACRQLPIKTITSKYKQPNLFIIYWQMTYKTASEILSKTFSDMLEIKTPAAS